jgi:hypothetical protein
MRRRTLKELLGGGAVYALSGGFFGLIVALFGHGDSFLHRWELASLGCYAALVAIFGPWLIGCAVVGVVENGKWIAIGAGVTFVAWLIIFAYWH